MSLSGEIPSTEVFRQPVTHEEQWKDAIRVVSSLFETTYDRRSTEDSGRKGKTISDTYARLQWTDPESERHHVLARFGRRAYDGAPTTKLEYFLSTYEDWEEDIDTDDDEPDFTYSFYAEQGTLQVFKDGKYFAINEWCKVVEDSDHCDDPGDYYVDVYEILLTSRNAHDLEQLPPLQHRRSSEIIDVETEFAKIVLGNAATSRAVNRYLNQALKFESFNLMIDSENIARVVAQGLGNRRRYEGARHYEDEMHPSQWRLDQHVLASAIAERVLHGNHKSLTAKDEGIQGNHTSD